MKPSEFLARIDERQIHIDETLSEILKQTQLTNGRVTKLENWRSKLNGIWFAVLLIASGVGGIAAIVFGILNLIK